MPSFYDLLNPQNKEKLITTQLKQGCVFRMHLASEEGVKDKNPGDNGRNKFFVVLGVTQSGDVIGIVLINSNINSNLPKELKDLHYPLLAKDHDFLTRNSFVDCSQIKEIKRDRFASMFNVSSQKGIIKEKDIELIIGAVKSSGLIPVKQLKKFGLL